MNNCIKSKWLWQILHILTDTWLLLRITLCNGLHGDFRFTYRQNVYTHILQRFRRIMIMYCFCCDSVRRTWRLLCILPTHAINFSFDKCGAVVRGDWNKELLFQLPVIIIIPIVPSFRHILSFASNLMRFRFSDHVYICKEYTKSSPKWIICSNGGMSA